MRISLQRYKTVFTLWNPRRQFRLFLQLDATHEAQSEGTRHSRLTQIIPSSKCNVLAPLPSPYLFQFSSHPVMLSGKMENRMLPIAQLPAYREPADMGRRVSAAQQNCRSGISFSSINERQKRFCGLFWWRDILENNKRKIPNGSYCWWTLHFCPIKGVTKKKKNPT